MMRRRAFLAGGAALAAGCALPRRDAESYEIWDQHGHLGARLGSSPVEQMEALLKIADRMGITRLIMMAFGPHEATPAEMRKTNDDYLRALERAHPRALGFVFINPQHVEASLQEIDRCVRDGPMVGFKPHVAKRCNAPELDPILRRAVELQAVVYQHTWLNNLGNLPGESTPSDAVELALRHPDARLICGHAGGRWELGIRTIRAVKHLPVEIAGFDPQAGAVEMAVRELGAERVIFGSDVPGRSFASQLAKVTGADIPDEAKRLILGANVKRMLTPILKAKGIPL
jgi:predicted TIM-barrel fold metal-dependent hydrolase